MVSQNYKIRIKFTKTGRLKFISHLDLNRTIKSALLRAKIPMWYSEGFNPRPKVVFALPLSIGVESVCEYMDITVVEQINFDEVKERFSNTLTDEMTVIDVYEAGMKFNDIGYAEYKFCFDEKIDIEKLNSPMRIMKRSKSGEKEVDIQPLVKRYEYDAENNILTALLNADSESYLSPDYLAKALTYGGYDICRTNIYMTDGETVFK
jgi:radical SAM-linked protein